MLQAISRSALDLRTVLDTLLNSATRLCRVETSAPYLSLAVATRDRGACVETRVRDNGTGIPEHVRARMFDPFVTIKPAAEGTRLGPSLSHDIVVKQHGGAIDVATEAGRFTEFTIVLPRGRAASDPAPGLPCAD